MAGRPTAALACTRDRLYDLQRVSSVYALLIESRRAICTVQQQPTAAAIYAFIHTTIVADA